MPAVDMVDTFDLKGQKACFIQFETRPEQVMQPSGNGGLPVPKLTDDGVPIYKDVDFVTVRQPGGVDSVVYEVEDWLKRILPMEVNNNRLNPEIDRRYRDAYKRWKAGQEEPVEGTSIKNWAVPSPAQVKMLIDLNIRTVEELAELTDDGVRRIGMGGIDLKLKAKAFLNAARDGGKIAGEMAAIKKENDLLKANMAQMKEQLDALSKKK